jgi:N-carbamoyl-L-amino-acid hydrolase
MHALAAEIVATARDAARQCSVTANVRFDDTVEPVLLDAGVQGVIEQSAASLGYRTLRMPSGAGHDAQNMARIAPAGMIFVPSADGRSHTKQEYSSPADLERGANVLLETLTRLCGTGPSARR